MALKLKTLVATVLLCTFAGVGRMSAQQVALKTNLLVDAATTPNIGVEIGTGKKHSFQVFYGLNPWKFGSGDDQKFLKHWIVYPEYRYWFCHRFNGSFVGVHAFGGEYDAARIHLPFGMYPGLRDNEYDGWFAGGGLTYGYQWVLSRHWNFEAAIGVGVAYIHYNRYPCGVCGRKSGTGHKTYVGPTKAALSMLYMF